MDDPVWSREVLTSGWPFETVEELKAATARYWNLHPDERDTLLRLYDELVRDLCREFGVDEPALWAIAQERLPQAPKANNGAWSWVQDSDNGQVRLVDDDGGYIDYDFQTIRLFGAYGYYGDVLGHALFKTLGSIIGSSPTMLEWFKNPERTDDDLRSIPPVGVYIDDYIADAPVWVALSFTRDVVKSSYYTQRTGYVADAFMRFERAHKHLRSILDSGMKSWPAEDEYRAAKIAAAQAFYEWENSTLPLGDDGFFPMVSSQPGFDLIRVAGSIFTLTGDGSPPRSSISVGEKGAGIITYGNPFAGRLTPTAEALYLRRANGLGADHIPTFIFLFSRASSGLSFTPEEFLEFCGTKKDAASGTAYNPDTKRRAVERVLEVEPLHIDAPYHVPTSRGMKETRYIGRAFEMGVVYSQGDPTDDLQLPYPDRYRNVVAEAIRVNLGAWANNEDAPKQYAQIHVALAKYKAGNGRTEEYAQRIGIYLSWQFRIRSQSRNWEQSFIRKTITTEMSIEVPKQNRLRFQKYFQDALGLLQRDGVIESWRPAKAASENGTFEAWHKGAIIVMPSKPVRDHYEAMQQRGSERAAARMKYALPARKRKAPSSNGSTKPRKRTARAT